jgi:hypothetical protein
MAVVVIGGLLTSTFLAIFVTPSLYTLLDDLQSKVFRPAHVAEVPAERVVLPAPSHVIEPVPVGAARAAVAVAEPANGHNGHTLPNGANGNGHGVEPAWLQKLRSGAYEDD